MRRILTCIVLGIFLCSSVVSASVSVSPETQHFDLTAGDSVNSEITVTNNNGEDIVGFIVTEVEPDGEGITVTYSADPDPFIAYPIFELGSYETIIFDMLIETDISLAPGVYTITTTFMKIDGEHTSSTEYIYETITETKTVTVEDTERINELLALIADLEDMIDDLKNSQGDSQNIIDSLESIIESLQDQIDGIPEQSTSDNNTLIYLLIAVIIIFLIIVIYLIIRLSKLKEK